MKIDLANPPELERCELCGKIAGGFKGYYGAECQCGRPTAAKPARSHSISTRAPKKSPTSAIGD